MTQPTAVRSDAVDHQCVACRSVAVASITLVCPRGHRPKLYLCVRHMADGSRAVSRTPLTCDDCGGPLTWRRGVSG